MPNALPRPIPKVPAFPLAPPLGVSVPRTPAPAAYEPARPEAPLIGGKSLQDWNREWRQIEGGLRLHHPELRHVVGLYRFSLSGSIKVLGKGTDKSAGLAKRLSDFRRLSDSARKHHAGLLAHEHLDDLTVEVLITGTGAKAREIARRLRAPMIRLHQPAWTVQNAPFMPRG